MNASDRFCAIVGETSRNPPEGWAWGGFWFAFEPSQNRQDAHDAELAFVARLTSVDASGNNAYGNKPPMPEEAFASLRRATMYGVHSFKFGAMEVLVTVPMGDRSLADDVLDENVTVLSFILRDDAESLLRYVLTGQR